MIRQVRGGRGSSRVGLEGLGVRLMRSSDRCGRDVFTSRHARPQSGAAAIWAVLTSAGSVGAAHAQDAPPQEAKTPPAVSPVDGGDELLQFQDIPVVITGSRTEQPITQSSVPVSIITAADIRYSGTVHFEDLLLNVPGVDVLRLDRNRFAIGVRGMHHEFADRTLFLIDGRDASDPFFAGVDFQRLPLFAADVERIEVVRGPGGAAWGANAFNGVVNILTKSPEDTTGAYASSRIDEFGDTFSQLRYGAKDDTLAWRVSLGYENDRTSSAALDSGSFTSNDFARRTIFDSEGVYKVSDSTKLDAGVGYTRLTRGSEEFLLYQPQANYNLWSVRPHVKLEHEWNSESSGYVRWFGNFDESDRPGFWKYFGTENDLEAQYNGKLGSAHRITAGANARLVTIDTQGNPPDTIVNEQTFQEGWLGGFLIDRWDVSRHLTLETQARLDWYSETQTDWSGRITAMYALDSSKNHVLRVAGAKAFRAPADAIREVDVLHVPVGGGLYGINLVRNPDLKNEETYSGELGYSGALGGGLSTNLTAYYTRYERLIGNVQLDDPLNLGRAFYKLENIDGANAYGFEGDLSLTGERGKLSTWFAYNAFDPDQGVLQGIRAFRPAEYKAGATLRWNITDRLTFNSTYRYTSTTANTPSDQPAAASTHRVDLAWTYRLGTSVTELTAGVNDLLDSTREVVDQVGQFSPHETPGRTFFVMLRVGF